MSCVFSRYSEGEGRCVTHSCLSHEDLYLVSHATSLFRIYFIPEEARIVRTAVGGSSELENDGIL